jgi:superfamily II DNA or RNA helicase
MVRIIRKGGLLLLQPWRPSLARILSYKKRERDHQQFPPRYTFRQIDLFVLPDTAGKSGITLGGFYKRVIDALKADGVPYEVVDQRNPLPEPKLDRLSGELRARQDVALATIASTHMGIIACPTAFGKTFLISQLTLIYPDERILVVSPRKPVVKDIYRRICEVNDAKVSMVAGSKFYPESNVIVCTTGSLHKIDTDWPTMILFDEVHGAGAEKVSSQLQEFSAYRRYGFSASAKGRADGADVHVEGLFGPIVYEVPYDTAVDDGTVSPIQVWMVNVEAPEMSFMTDVSKERNGYWRHRRRNKIIAAAAKHFKDEEQILILVKTAEHALFIRHFLPEFSIVHSGIDNEKWQKFLKLGLVNAEEKKTLAKVDTEQMKEDFRECRLKKVIATTCWKEGVDFPKLAVVIRADGMSGSIPAIQMGGRLSRIADGKGKGILIDFIDDFGNTYLRRSEQRMRNYKKNKWEIVHGWQPT